MPALALARGETARFRELWLSLAAGDAGRFFLGFLKKPAVREQLYAFVAADLPFHCVFQSGQSSQYLPTLPYDPVQMADFVQLSHTLGILGLVFVGLSTVLAVLSCCFFRRRSRLLYFGLFVAVAALVLDAVAMTLCLTLLI